MMPLKKRERENSEGAAARFLALAPQRSLLSLLLPLSSRPRAGRAPQPPPQVANLSSPPLKDRADTRHDSHEGTTPIRVQRKQKSSTRENKKMGVYDPPDPKYDAFRRTDIYGPAGKAPVSLLRAAWFCLAGVTFVPLKAFCTVAWIFYFYCVCK